MGLSADDDGELALMVYEFTLARRQHNRCVRGGQGACWLQEDQRLGWDGVGELLCVLSIIPRSAHDLRAGSRRCIEGELGERVIGTTGLRLTVEGGP
jgi:hypothetical protein